MNGNGLVARSFMTLCFVSAALLLLTQWYQQASRGAVQPELALGPDPAAQPEEPRPRPGQGSGGGFGGLVPTFQRLVPTESAAIAPPAPSAPFRVAAMGPALRSLVRPSLVVDLSDRRVSVYQGVVLQSSYDIAVGKAGWETPVGTFVVNDMQVDPHWKHPITGQDVGPGPDNPLGSRWIGFWSDGENVIGFHGTHQTDLIGQAVSHGCIRMRNGDIEALFQQVAPGTAVIVQP